MTPQRILQNRYSLIRKIKAGGMGVVYEANDQRLSCKVAVKELTATSEEVKRSFEREAKLLANLRHPALPQVSDYFIEDSRYLVMDYIEGQDFKESLDLKKSPFAVAEVLRWADELLDVLCYLHSRNPPVIHRDIKPSNLKLRPDGGIVLLDFGIAKGSIGTSTESRSIIGFTKPYAPYEQQQGEVTTPQSDLYALAATLYHLLTAQEPKDALSRAYSVLHDEADPLDPVSQINPEVPAVIGSIIAQGMAIKEADRPRHAEEMREALRRATEDASSPPISHRVHVPSGETTIVRPRPPQKLPVAIEKEKVNEVGPRIVQGGDFSLIANDTAEYFFEAIHELVADNKLDVREKVANLRDVVHQLMQQITAKEPFYFSNFYSMCVFVFNKYTVPGDVSETIHGLRKLRNRIRDYPQYVPSEGQYLGAARAACLAVQQFSILVMPSALREICDSPLCEWLGQKSYSEKSERIRHLKATFLRAARKETETAWQGSRVVTYLSCEAEELGKITVACYGPLNDIDTCLWDYAPLHFFNINQNAKRETFYQTTQQSLIVIDPDYLIDVTHIAECFQQQGVNPHLYLLKKFISGKSSKSMVLGNIVNHFFDYLMRRKESNRNLDFQSLYERALRQQTLFLALLDDLNEVELRKDAHQQYNNLLEFIDDKLKDYLKGKVIIEPTFMSEIYGIQGRLDALLGDNEEISKTKTVIELKSGKVPSRFATIEASTGTQTVGMWSTHYAQTTCYDLLLDSTFEGRKGFSSLLYSQDPAKLLRNAYNIPEHKRDVLMVRNKIIALEQQLAEGMVESILKINPREFGVTPPFHRADIAHFDRLLQSASALEKAYFFSFISFIAREQRVAKTGVDSQGNECFAALWRNSMEKKKSSFSILDGLQFDEEKSDFSSFEIAFKRPHERANVTNLRQGDIAVLYSIADNDAPLRHEVFRCTISKLTQQSVTVKLRGEQAEPQYFQGVWALERDMLDGGYRTMYQALFDFLSADSEKKESLLGLRKPEFATRDYEKTGRVNNGEQYELLTRALSAKDYFLLQGPPGTGKTKIMLAEMVRHLHEHTGEEIALLAFTNRAVDEICDTIKELNAEARQNSKSEIPFLRLGGKESTKNADCLLSEKASRLTVKQVRELIQNTRVFVSTVSSFAHNRDLVSRKNFSTAIIDEASQLLEPHLIGILAKVRRFILIGDEKQLPAVVVQPEKDRRVDSQELKELGIQDLSHSLFERLLRRAEQLGWTDCYGMLSYQGRMHQEIARFPNETFYDGKLKFPQEWQTQPLHRFSQNLSGSLAQLLSKSRLLFIESERRNKRKQNDDEARIVADLLETIYEVYGDEFYDTEGESVVGVITPYRNQIATIKETLPQHLRERVTVDTVERFQGGQNEIIIISFAVTSSFEIPNLEALTADQKVDRKLNVAMTRARKHLILTGCPEFLNRGRYFKELIAYIKSKNGYIGLEYKYLFKRRMDK